MRADLRGRRRSKSLRDALLRCADDLSLGCALRARRPTLQRWEAKGLKRRRAFKSGRRGTRRRGDRLPVHHGDLPFWCSDLPFRRTDSPFRCSDSPFRCSDSPFRCADSPFRCTDLPFRCTDLPFRCTDLPFRCTETAFRNWHGVGPRAGAGPFVQQTATGNRALPCSCRTASQAKRDLNRAGGGGGRWLARRRGRCGAWSSHRAPCR